LTRRKFLVFHQNQVALSMKAEELAIKGSKMWI
jgi:hypothetical protein